MQDFSKIGLHKVRQSPISDDNVKQTEDTKLKEKPLKKVLKDGLTANCLKVIAILAMTIDHAA